jgi:hypothetical protein
MKPLTIPFTIIGLLSLSAPSWAVQLNDAPAERVTVEVDSVGLHPGMPPGMYVCAASHLHIKGTVQNLTQAPLGRIKVGGRAYDADGNLLGTATASTRKTVLSPGERAEINVEFLTVTGEMLDKVKLHELTVLGAPAAAQ